MTARRPATFWAPVRAGVLIASLAAASIASLAPAPARADDAGAAKQLFDHGLDELKQGHLDAACTAFAESYQLNPLPGALFTLAECESKRGRIASAVRRYEEYLTVFAKLPRDKQQKQRGRDAVSKEQVTALTPAIPHVTLVVPEDAPAGIVVTVDGKAVERASLGRPLPLDPGDHVAFSAGPGLPSAEQRFTLARGEQKTLPLDVKAPQKPAPVEAGPSALRIAGFVVGGVGVASLVAFATTGGLALGKKATIKDNCVLDAAHGVASCNPTGLSAGRAATTLGTVSTATLVVGLAALGAGIGMVVAGGGDTKAAASSGRPTLTVLPLGAGGLALGVTGAW